VDIQGVERSYIFKEQVEAFFRSFGRRLMDTDMLNGESFETSCKSFETKRDWTQEELLQEAKELEE